MSEYINQVNVLEKAISEASSAGEHENAAYYQRVIDAIKHTKVIDSLSSNGIIPKYGFPVDSVNLDVYENGIYNRVVDHTYQSSYVPGTNDLSFYDREKSDFEDELLKALYGGMEGDDYA